jgi:ribosomal protein S12 methylthiotransferase
MRYGKELAESLPEADVIMAEADVLPVVGAGLNPAPTTGPRPLLSLPGSAYVKISDGCNNRCSFCAIPLIRGPLTSRQPDDIIEECNALVARGIKELVFIGQDIGSYGMDWDGKQHLVELLRLVGVGLKPTPTSLWIRLLYIHPDHFPEGLLDLCAENPSILPYFDIPFQHGSDKILKQMGRRKTAAEYLQLITAIRSKLPGAVIRSTFMTGFPGETDEDFAALQDFQQKAQLDWAGAFAYSREDGTAAYSMKNQVPKKTARTRLRLIEEAQTAISEKRLQSFVGKTLDVLIEEKIEDDAETGEDFYLGRAYNQAPEVDGATVLTSETPLTPGTLVKARITACTGVDLQGFTL